MLPTSRAYLDITDPISSLRDQTVASGVFAKVWELDRIGLYVEAAALLELHARFRVKHGGNTYRYRMFRLLTAWIGIFSRGKLAQAVEYCCNMESLVKELLQDSTISGSKV